MSKQVCSSKKGGPYTSVQKTKRWDIVAKYYFEYEYSARKISQVMKINRNTINRDINYLHTKMNEKNEGKRLESLISKSLEKMTFQRTRLRETLDEAKTISEKATIEKLILAVENNITQINMKLVSTDINVIELVNERANEVLKNSRKDERLISAWSYAFCSKNAQEKIDKILQEDKKLK